MKISKSLTTLLLTGLIGLISAPADAQWVTIARKVKSMRTGTTDIAHVIIDAGTTNVYKAVIDTLTSNPKVNITLRDDKKRQVQFNNELYIVAIQVDSLGTNLSQITVAAVSSGIVSQPKTDVAVKTIFGVCNKAGINCVLEE
jgi:hypothetical protein